MQVYCNNELVGLWKQAVRPGEREVSLRLLREPPLLAPGTWDGDGLVELEAPVVESVKMPITKRSVAINNFDLEISRDPKTHVAEILRFHRVPDDAEKRTELSRDEAIYTWKILVIDPDTYEKVFDCDHFEPV